jgi:hypothetical protein
MTDGFITDGEVLKQAGEILDQAADVAEPLAREFDERSHIPTEAFGGVALPPTWNFSGRLADLLAGPYAHTAALMSAAVSRSALVLRKNSDAVIDAARLYLAQDEYSATELNRWPR